MLQAIPRNLAAVFVSCLLLCTSAVAQERHMQLLASDTGWVLGANKLYWTTDNGGRWEDITPPCPVQTKRSRTSTSRTQVTGGCCSQPARRTKVRSVSSSHRR